LKFLKIGGQNAKCPEEQFLAGHVLLFNLGQKASTHSHSGDAIVRSKQAAQITLTDDYNSDKVDRD
jgi:hypothetical protein